MSAPLEPTRAQQLVAETLTVEFEVELSKIMPSARLREELGLDSLDGVDLIVAIEKAIGAQISEADARQIKTVGDLYSYLQSAH